MQEAAIVLRYARAVVSQRIETPRGPGWDCALNWEDLEAEAFQAIAANFTDGPYVFPCPPDLARRALFAPPDMPPELPLLSLPVQRPLWSPESEAQL